MPTFDGVPDIVDYDNDLITKEQLAEKFQVTLSTIDQWRFGRQGRMPLMPYLRLGNILYFSKAQIVWWLNQYQKQLDPYHVDRMRRLKEGMSVGKPKTRKPV